MTTWWAVLLGGAIGTGARHGVNALAASIFSTAAPYATASVNLMGSFVVGLLAGALVSQRIAMTEPMRVFVFVGIIGGFTTFSSLMLDTLTLFQSGAGATAVINLVGQLIVGLALVVAGYQIGLGL